jgi:hypothetical protein
MHLEADAPTSGAPPKKTPATPPLPLLGLRCLNIEFMGEDELTALLKLISPCTLTRLDLSAAHLRSNISDVHTLLQQLPELQQLQHCKLGYCSCNGWEQGAAQLAAVRQLSNLTYLCLERGGLTAKALARHLYCTADALPELRVLEINKRLKWESPDMNAYVRMGPRYAPELDLCNVKYDAEVGAERQKQLANVVTDSRTAGAAAMAASVFKFAANRPVTWYRIYEDQVHEFCATIAVEIGVLPSAT